MKRAGHRFSWVPRPSGVTVPMRSLIQPPSLCPLLETSNQVLTQKTVNGTSLPLLSSLVPVLGQVGGNTAPLLWSGPPSPSHRRPSWGRGEWAQPFGAEPTHPRSAWEEEIHRSGSWRQETACACGLGRGHGCDEGKKCCQPAPIPEEGVWAPLDISPNPEAPGRPQPAFPSGQRCWECV